MTGDQKRIEDAVKALEKGELKRALLLLEKKGFEKEFSWVKEAAQKSLGDRGNIKKYTLEARNRLQETITEPLNDTSLEGVEEYIKREVREMPEMPKPEANLRPVTQASDDPEYQECEECHIVTAVGLFGEICSRYNKEDCSILDDIKEDTTPQEWLGRLKKISEEATGEAKEQFNIVLSDLTQYLNERNSPLKD